MRNYIVNTLVALIVPCATTTKIDDCTLGKKRLVEYHAKTAAICATKSEEACDQAENYLVLEKTTQYLLCDKKNKEIK
jgi:hypothetical protein